MCYLYVVERKNVVGARHAFPVFASYKFTSSFLAPKSLLGVRKYNPEFVHIAFLGFGGEGTVYEVEDKGRRKVLKIAHGGIDYREDVITLNSLQGTKAAKYLPKLYAIYQHTLEGDLKTFLK